MRDKKYAGIIAGLFVVSITAFTIWGTDFLQSRNASEAVAMDVKGTEGIKEASTMKDKDGNVTGYTVVTTSKGFAGDVEITVSFEADGTKISGFELGANSETPSIGSKIGDAEFTGALTGVAAPVQLKGTNGTGTEIDGVTGATFSSTAAETSINNAYNFIQSNK
ncbi:MAG: FMN-binding protein [bacterium]|nr:FMN-binding protein [bacterium]